VAAVDRLRRVRTFVRCGDERGSTALVIMLAMVVVVVVFMAGANLVVFEYGQGTVRTAVDEAARAGSQQLAPGGPIGACQAKAAEVMANLLPGPFGRGVTITCTQTGTDVVATATGRFPGWLPPIPALSVHIQGVSHLERNPT
jgi:hypothetical protein